MTLGSSLIALVASMMQPPAAEEQNAAQNAPPSQAEQPPEVESPANTEGLGEDQRRRPGVPQEALERPVEQVNPGAIRSPPPEAYPTDHIPIPDRWRLIDTLGVARENYLDPYNQNTLKGDRPICTPTLAATDERHRRSLGCRLFDSLGLGGGPGLVGGRAL